MKGDWIDLGEHESIQVSPQRLTLDVGRELWELYGRDASWLSIDFPSPKTNGDWSLSASSSVGSFPLADGGGVRVRPKVPVHNLFRMLEVAHGVELRTLDGEVLVEDIDDLFSRLAARLARQVLQRARRGLVKDYRREQEALPYVRGRIDVTRDARRPVRARIDCRFQEHTPDQHDNRVLLWTLHHLARSPLLKVGARRDVRRAVRVLAPTVRVEPVDAADAVRRFYDRLRADYYPMHRLCRFCLLNAGPTHRSGRRATTPFVVAMPTLFEHFVANSLKSRLPDDLALDAQHDVHLDSVGGVRFVVDLVVRDRRTGRKLLALDTKYKDHATPASGDVQQAIAYAAALGCRRAALVYPSESTYGSARAGDVQVHRLELPLAGVLEPAVDQLVDTVVGLARHEHSVLEEAALRGQNL